MRREVVVHAPVLAELPAVNVLHRGGDGGSVVIFDPHAHAHILHLEQLQQQMMAVRHQQKKDGGRKTMMILFFLWIQGQMMMILYFLHTDALQFGQSKDLTLSD